MKLFGKEINKDKFLYGGLIITFIVLYAVTAFVSFYHAITFFNIANAVWLSVLLSFVAEIGQASVLFSILLTDNKRKFLPWVVMVILTTLQVIGNVVSSYDWIIAHNGSGVESFQKSILFWMTTANPEIFKVVISWISGALLPIIALSMTALVAQNMELRAHKARTNLDEGTTIEDGIDTNDGVDEERVEINSPVKIESIAPYDDIFDKNLVSKLENIINQRQPKTKEEVIEEIQKEEKEIKEEEKNLESKESEKREKEIEEKVKQKVAEEVDRIKKIMLEIPVLTGAISPDVKEIVAPGILNYDQEIKTDDSLKSAIDNTYKEYTSTHFPPIVLPDIPLVGATEEETAMVTSDENIIELNKGEEKDFLNDEFDHLIPEIKPDPVIENISESNSVLETEEKPVPDTSPEPIVKHQHGLVEGIGDITPKTSESEQKQISEEQLEKIRRLAREQGELKKK